MQSTERNGVCAAAHAQEYICSGGSGVHSEHDIAEATAEAFAIAVATASADCELEGDAAVYVKAGAHAKAAAEVFVEAYADAFASSTVCGTCDAYASSWGYVSKHVFLEAVAKAGFLVCTLQIPHLPSHCIVLFPM